MKKGLKSYFAKYSFQNTELPQFIAELDAAAKSLGIQGFSEWSDTWLRFAGCARLSFDLEQDAQTGQITSFNIV